MNKFENIKIKLNSNIYNIIIIYKYNKYDKYILYDNIYINSRMIILN